MIVYFSATGNCAYVAKRIGDATGEKAIDLESLFDPRNNPTARPTLTVPAGERLGFVVPTHVWSLPSIVEDFLNAVSIDAAPGTYVYYVGTYGTLVGAPSHAANKCAGLAKHPICASFSVKMPDTWTPMFDLSDARRVAAANNAAEPLIDEAIAHICARDTGNFMHNRTPGALASAVHRLAYPRLRRTSHFHVEDSCTGCGLCAKNCPVGAITIQDGRPVWTADSCTICLRCLHRCPVFAIQYGTHTKTHGQYRNPHSRKG